MYPRIVSLLGGGGLAGTLAYLAGVYLAFQPGWEQWAEFFVPWSIPLMIIPFVLLISYLYTRTRLGHWYIEHERIGEAIAFCEPRIEANFVTRGRKEALCHRIALARAYLARHEYERVEELLASGYSAPERGRLALEVYRWRFEAALRAENLVRCHRVWEAASSIGRPRRPRAYLLACRAELAVREGDQQSFDAAIDEAAWADADNARVQVAEVLGVWRFDATRTKSRQALDVLTDAIVPVSREVPGRKAELLALRAELLVRVGRTDQARRALEAACRAPADARSEHELSRVKRLFESEKSKSSTHP